MERGQLHDSMSVRAYVRGLPNQLSLFTSPRPQSFLAYRRCTIEGAATPALSCSFSSAGTYAYICPSAMHVVVRFHTVKLSCEHGQEGSGTARTLWKVVASCTCAQHRARLKPSKQPTAEASEGSPGIQHRWCVPTARAGSTFRLTSHRCERSYLRCSCAGNAPPCCPRCPRSRPDSTA
jgi:hypothetical protein